MAKDKTANDWPARFSALAFVILHSSFPISSAAHPADNSQARFKIEPRRVETRLTLNLYTLQQFHKLDANDDGTISKKELDDAEQALRAYLVKHVLITIDGDDTDLGEARRMVRMWPEVSTGPDVVAADYGLRFVDFVFVREWKATIDTVWIGYDIFKETGDLHAIQGVFEQDGARTDVAFSKSEPEYEWATDFTDTKQKKDKPAATPQSVEPTTVPTRHGPHPLVIIVALVVAIGTWMLLRKVNRISRGAFRIGMPPPEDREG